MSKSTHDHTVLVQKLITSYFLAKETSFHLLSTSTCPMGSICSKWTSDLGYISETPVSKQGKTEFYLGECNTIEESSRRALLSVVSTDSDSYPTTSFEYTPSLSAGRASPMRVSPTTSYKSMVL
jgi:hypothetical protein